MENLLLTLFLSKIDALKELSNVETVEKHGLNLILITIQTPKSIIEIWQEAIDCKNLYGGDQFINLSAINRYIVLDKIRPEKSSPYRTKLKRKLKL